VSKTVYRLGRDSYLRF